MSMGQAKEENWDDDQGEQEEKQLDASERSLLQKVLHKGIVPNNNDIQVQRKDPKSPLYSIKSFQELNLPPKLLKGLLVMGFASPSKIQETALPLLMGEEKQNMIAQSQSGTGKTAAFLLATLSKIDVSKSHPQAIIVAPTYELALQIAQVAMDMSRFMTELTLIQAVRGETFVKRGQILTEHVIIGTPGKIVDWLTKQRCFDPKKIRTFVLDEADIMIDIQGHQDQSMKIQRALDIDRCQMMLFSATYGKEVMQFAENIIENPVIIRLKREEESIDNIGQYWIDCPTAEDKFEAICNIYAVVTIGQTMIFCRTKKTASWLAKRMESVGNRVAMLNGDLKIEDRIRVLDNFREGNERVLISTNVMGRGIDIPQVTFVVNYDMPVTLPGQADCETYLHRIGRTGRFGQRGLAVNLVDGTESALVLQQIEDHFGRPIHKLNSNDPSCIAQIYD